MPSNKEPQEKAKICWNHYDILLGFFSKLCCNFYNSASNSYLKSQSRKFSLSLFLHSHDIVLLFSLPSAACGRGFYKSSSQDLQCSRCPAHSFNDREGSWRCDCEDGYYRALSDPPSVACTSKCAPPLLRKHRARIAFRGSGFKQGEKKKKNRLVPCSTGLQWSQESPRCVPIAAPSMSL